MRIASLVHRTHGLRLLSCSLLLGALPWLALYACDDGGGGIDSGVDGNKQLTDLTGKEADKICDAAEEYGESALSERVYRRAACATIALSEGDIASCREVQAECEQGELDGGSDVIGVPQASLPQETPACFETSQLEGCDATVAELESCYEALVGQRLRSLYAVRCESLVSQRGPIVQEPGELPVCTKLEAKCPGVRPQLTSRPIVIEPPPERDGGDIIVPPPPTDTPTCAELSLSFDGSDCQTTGCSASAECDCAPFTQSYNVCNPVRGCLASLDCDLACAAGSSVVYNCGSDTSCDSDADCDGHYCVDQGFGGTCSRGEPGDTCIDSADCGSGTCSSGSSGMRCVGDGVAGSDCDDDLECASGICFIDYTVSPVQGACSSGALGEPCSSDDECVDLHCVYAGASTSECSDGDDGSACDDDSDCDSGTCAYGGRSSQTCSDRQLDAPCDSSSDCVSGLCQLASSSSSETTCAPAVGDVCDGGVIDCNSDCSPAQGDCGSALCVPTCNGDSCSSETLATWTSESAYGSPVISGGDDLSVTGNSGFPDELRATLGQTSGQYYWELSVGALGGYSGSAIGVTSLVATLTGTSLPSVSVPGAVMRPDGTIVNSAGDSLTGCGYRAGDVVGVALDLDDELIYFSVNGVWQAGGSPDDADGGLDVDLTGETVHPVLELWPSDSYTANFGQSTFAFEPPTGYEALH